MSFKCGIVGLPNVGKSTLFNALTKSNAAEVANYPFCTIEPNSGIILVPDKRLDRLAEIANSAVKKYTQISIFDIAGLVRNAHKGEGLGNLFLSHIREVDAIIHMVRCFSDKNIAHVEQNIDPLLDIEIINLELIMADLKSLEKRLANMEKKSKKGEELDLLKTAEVVIDVLKSEKMASEADVSKEHLKALQLITAKPVMYVCNVDESSAGSGNEYSKIVMEKFPRSIIVSAAIEAELCALSEEEKQSFLNEINLKESGLHSLIKGAYDLLGLQTFFTIGPKEARAWTIKNGCLAPQAAGVIHSDMERGFIKADTISYNDYIEYKGESGCREKGKLRQEGRDYVVQDGDIFNFKFNV